MRSPTRPPSPAGCRPTTAGGCTIPAGLPRERLTLIGARRCLSTDGQVAHVLYRHAGRPVSLFMMPGRFARRRARCHGRSRRPHLVARRHDLRAASAARASLKSSRLPHTSSRRASDVRQWSPDDTGRGAMNKRWLVVAVGVGLVVAAFTPLPERMGRWFAGEPVSAQGCSPDAPQANLDFTLKDMNGHDVKLADLKGKVVLLNFWATWCGPCRLEIPWFVEFQEQVQGARASASSASRWTTRPRRCRHSRSSSRSTTRWSSGGTAKTCRTRSARSSPCRSPSSSAATARCASSTSGRSSKEQFESEIKSLL